MEEKTANKKKNNSNKKNTKKKQEKKVKVKNDVIKEEKKDTSKGLSKKVEQKPVTKKKEITTSTPVTGSEIGNLIKIILIVTAIFLIFYGITTLVTKNPKLKDDDKTQETTIQYDEILLGNLLTQSNDEYYVLVTKEDDQYISAYSTYISAYKAKTKAIRVYTSNLDSGFNKSYASEQSKTNISNISELKLKGSTLLKIKNKKIVSAYEGNTKIIEHLKSLIK